MQLFHQRCADSASSRLRNNVQRKDMSVEGIFNTRQSKSKNPSDSLRHACYALGVIERKLQLCAGKCNILCKAGFINPMEYIQVVSPEFSNFYGLFGHAAIIIPGL